MTEGAEWWGARRRRYNLAVVVAGMAAFACQLAAFQIRCSDTPGAEITIFTTIFQAIIYLLAMCVANVCYLLGAGLDRFIQFDALPRYRRWAFRAGLAFSVALPFAIPVGVLVEGCARGRP